MTERFVIDASVIAKTYLRDEGDLKLADQLMDGFALGAVDLVAPEYILYEVPSTILNAVRRRRIDAAEGRAAVEEFFGLDIPTIGGGAASHAMVRRAYELASRLSCRLYDALYLLIAIELDRPLITADARLYRGQSAAVAQLAWLGDYRPAASP